VTWAHHALLEGDRKGLKYGLILTVVLGACFTCVQAYEYAHAAFGFSGNMYGATFFMATGFHGFHVLVGTVFLLVCLFRAYAGHFTPTQHLGFEVAAWYWHFVDVVWLFLFVCIYVYFRGAEAVGHAAEEVKTGGGLGFALSQSKRFPKLALQMISVGEESGELDTMLMKVADTFDIEVKNTLDRLLAALVPATTIVMTVVVAMIMLAIVLPIMNIAGAVK